MKISKNWLNDYVDLSQQTDLAKLSEILTQLGFEVEEIHDQSKGLKQVLTAKILTKNRHPQADRLSLCLMDLGTTEKLEVVCGAQNMKEGDTVAMAQIGAHLPNDLKIEKSKIRGVVSNGMLCSTEELKLPKGYLGDKGDGILLLPQDTKLGVSISDLFGLNDTVFTLKLTPNRGDCMSHFGIARELAAYFNLPLNRPEHLAIGMSSSAAGSKANAAVTNSDAMGAGRIGSSLLTWSGSNVRLALRAGEDGPQFWGVSIDGIKVGPSPKWLVDRLESVGQRSLNNVVDATNFVLLEYGYPTHAYDVDRLESVVGRDGLELSIRKAKQGEKLKILDGRELTLDGFELVIAAGSNAEHAVGLAGSMGGDSTSVTDTTSRIFLECAEFAPGLVRRAAVSHLTRSESAMRFEKGIDSGNCEAVLLRLTQLIQTLAFGNVTGSTRVMSPSRQHLAKQGTGVGANGQAVSNGSIIQTSGDWLRGYLGASFSDSEIKDTFTRLGFNVDRLPEKGSSGIAVATPTYRNDLRLPVDLAEELARFLGYHLIPSTMPALTTAPLKPLSYYPQFVGPGGAPFFELCETAKDVLVSLGFNETISLALQDKKKLGEFGLPCDLKVLNPLSEEHEVLSPSLIPALIQSAIYNWNHIFSSKSVPIRLFELRPVWSGVANASSETDTGVIESWKMGLLMSGDRLSQTLSSESSKADFFDFKGVIEQLGTSLQTKGLRVQAVQPGEKKEKLFSMFHPGRVASVFIGNRFAGFMGELHPEIAATHKIRETMMMAELDWSSIASMSQYRRETRLFKSWSTFPPMERDYTLLIEDGITAAQLTNLAAKVGKPLARDVQILDVYRGAQVREGMTSVTIRITFGDDTRSLVEEEVEAVSKKLLEGWQKECRASLRV